MINWVLIDSYDRATYFGVGTFIEEFSRNISVSENAMLYIVHIGKANYREVTIIETSNITHVYIPYHFSFQNRKIDTKRNLEKFAERVVDFLHPVLSGKENLVFHLNYLFQFYIGKALRNRFPCTIVFTRHLILKPSLPFDDTMYDPEQDAYHLFDHIVCVSRHGKEDLVDNYKINPRKINVIHNGLDSYAFKASQKEIEDIKGSVLVKETEKLILYAGRIDTGKGVEYLIEIFKQCLQSIPDCRLVIAGDGNFTDILRLCKGIYNRVTFLGYVPREELLKLYAVADLGIIPSLEEQCSYVALEMLHSGLPVVATAVGGLKEILLHGQNSYLVDLTQLKTGAYPDVMKMSEYAIDLLMDNEKAANFSANAKKHALINFMGSVMCNKYLQLISKG